MPVTTVLPSCRPCSVVGLVAETWLAFNSLGGWERRIVKNEVQPFAFNRGFTVQGSRPVFGYTGAPR